MWICGKCYGFIRCFLNDRRQRVVLNERSSNCSRIEAGVPQGSILGSLLFLLYINDLPEGLTSVTKLFAGDTSHFLFWNHFFQQDANCQGECSKTFGPISWHETNFFGTNQWKSK